MEREQQERLEALKLIFPIIILLVYSVCYGNSKFSIRDKYVQNTIDTSSDYPIIKNHELVQPETKKKYKVKRLPRKTERMSFWEMVLYNFKLKKQWDKLLGIEYNEKGGMSIKGKCVLKHFRSIKGMGADGVQFGPNWKNILIFIVLPSISVILALAGLPFVPLFIGAAFTSKATGDWDAVGQTTWNEVGFPATGDTAQIQNTHVVSVKGTEGCGNTTVDVGGTLRFDGQADGTPAILNLDNGATLANSGTVDQTGTGSTGYAGINGVSTELFTGTAPSLGGGYWKVGQMDFQMDITTGGGTCTFEFVDDCTIDAITVTANDTLKCVTNNVTITGPSAGAAKEIEVFGTIQMNAASGNEITITGIRVDTNNGATVDFQYLDINYVSGGAVSAMVFKANITITQCDNCSFTGDAGLAVADTTMQVVTNCTFVGTETAWNRADVYLVTGANLVLDTCTADYIGLQATSGWVVQDDGSGNFEIFGILASSETPPAGYRAADITGNLTTSQADAYSSSFNTSYTLGANCTGVDDLTVNASTTFDTSGTNYSLTVATSKKALIEGTLNLNGSTVSIGITNAADFALDVDGGTVAMGSATISFGSIRAINASTITMSSGTTSVTTSYTIAGSNAYAIESSTTYSHANGTVQFTSAGLQGIWRENGATGNFTAFYNLVLNKAANNVQFINNRGFALTVANNLTITAGEFDTSETVSGTSRDLTVTGATSITGTLTANASTLNFAAVTINDAGTYACMTSDTNMSGNFIVGGGASGSATVTTGTFDLEGTLTINAGATLGANTAYRLDMAGNLNASAGTLSAPNAGGTFLFTGATWNTPTTFTHNSGTTQFWNTGTTTINNASIQFYDVNVGNLRTVAIGANNFTCNAFSIGGGASGVVTVTTATITVGGGLTIAAGATFGSNTAYTLDLNGSLIASAGTLNAPNAGGTFSMSGASWRTPTTFNHDNGTVTFDIAGTTTLGNASTDFNDITVNPGADLDTSGSNYALTAVDVDISGTITGNASAITFGSLAVQAAGTYSATSGTTTVNNEAAVFAVELAGTYTHNNGLLLVTTAAGTRLDLVGIAGNVYDLSLSGGNKEWFGNTTIDHDLNIISGKFYPTAGFEADDLTVTGEVTVTGTMGDGDETGAYAFGSLLVDAGGLYDATSGVTTIALESGTGFAIEVNATGTFTNNGGTVTITTNATTKIDMSGDSLNNLILNHAGLTLHMESDTTAIGDLTITLGELTTLREAGGINYTLDVTGEADITGTLTGNSSTISFGSLAIQVGGTYTATDATTTISSESGGGFAILVVGGATFTHSNGNVLITTAASTKIDMGGDSLYDVELNNGALFLHLESNTTIANTLTITVGELDTQNEAGAISYNLTVSGATDITGTLSGNASTTISFQDITINPAGTYTATSMTTNFSGDWDSTTGTFTHSSGTVVANGTTQSISGDNTWHNFTKSVAAADTLTFENTKTQTYEATVNLNGASGQLLSLVSDAPGTAWLFTMTPTATKGTIQYLDVTDSDASGSDPTHKPINPSNSTDSGGNTDWFPSVAGGNAGLSAMKMLIEEDG